MSEKPVNEAAVQTALAEFKDPETGRSAAQMGQLRDIRVREGELSLTLALTTWSAPLWQETRGELAGLLRSRFPSLTQVRIEPAIHERPPEKIGQIGLTAKSVIAVGSGKGGVGKSTIAASLAYRPEERRLPRSA